MRRSCFSKGLLRKFTFQVHLTDSFDIIQVVNKDKIIIESGLVEGFIKDSIFLINGSTEGGNDDLYTVKSISFDESKITVQVKGGGLKNDLVENGEVHVSKSVTIKHNLGTEALTLSIHNMITGDGIGLSNRILDKDNISLLAEEPTLGEYLITILA